jgi:hypothetical protein
MIIPNSNKNYAQVASIKKQFDQLDGLQAEYPTVYLVHNNSIKPWSQARYQFTLSDYKVNWYDVNSFSIDTIDRESIIISYENLAFEQKHQDVFRLYVDEATYETENDYIWVYGSEIKEYLDGKSNISISKLNKMQIPLQKFSSQINTSLNSNFVISNGKPGFLLYGPYISLEKGDYTVEVIYKVLEHTNNLNSEFGFLDVATNSGDIILNKAPIDNSGKLKIDFSLGSNVNDFEIRFYVFENAIVQVENVYLYQ